MLLLLYGPMHPWNVDANSHKLVNGSMESRLHVAWNLQRCTSQENIDISAYTLIYTRS